MFTYLCLRELNVDPRQSKISDRDRFALSKGRTVPGPYSALAYRGFFPVDGPPTLCHIGSYPQSRLNVNTVPGRICPPALWAKSSPPRGTIFFRFPLDRYYGY